MATKAAAPKAKSAPKAKKPKKLTGTVKKSSALRRVVLEHNSQMRDLLLAAETGLTEEQRAVVDPKKFTYAQQLFQLQALQGRSPGVAVLAYKRAFPEMVELDKVNLIFAWRLAKDPEVLRYLEEFERGLRVRHAASLDRVVAEVESIAFSNMLDYMTVNPITGQPSVDLRQLTPEGGAALSSFKVVVSGVGPTQTITTTINLHDKLGGLQILARMYGLDKAQKLTIEDVDRILNWLDSQLGPRPSPEEAKLIEHAEHHQAEEKDYKAQLAEVLDEKPQQEQAA